MDEKDIKKADAVIDLFVALFLLVIGGMIMLFGLSWIEFLEILPQSATFDWVKDTAWIPTIAGIIVIIYSAKRMLVNVLKMIT
ncbi:MAG: hypothetical protein KAW45_03890 [Thermoplasmatales archaeon]|nr:hypothetical protein [Thermoplasmatales archaeon]